MPDAAGVKTRARRDLSPRAFDCQGVGCSNDSRVDRYSTCWRYFLCPIVAALAGCHSHTGAVRVPDQPIDASAVPVAVAYGAKQTGRMAVSAADLAQLDAIFGPPAATAFEERRQIGQAIALLERIAGRELSLVDDAAGNETGPPGTAQLDCVAEATNATIYLQFLRQRGKLRFHAVRPPVFRAPRLLDPHNAACIEELATGERFVVDSWPRANGEEPVIQAWNDWRRKRPTST